MNLLNMNLLNNYDFLIDEKLKERHYLNPLETLENIKTKIKTKDTVFTSITDLSGIESFYNTQSENTDYKTIKGQLTQFFIFERNFTAINRNKNRYLNYDLDILIKSIGTTDANNKSDMIITKSTDDTVILTSINDILNNSKLKEVYFKLLDFKLINGVF